MQQPAVNRIPVNGVVLLQTKHNPSQFFRDLILFTWANRVKGDFLSEYIHDAFITLGVSQRHHTTALQESTGQITVVQVLQMCETCAEKNGQLSSALVSVNGEYFDYQILLSLAAKSSRDLRTWVPVVRSDQTNLIYTTFRLLSDSGERVIFSPTQFPPGKISSLEKVATAQADVWYSIMHNLTISKALNVQSNFVII